jgi:NAD-dependent SIR2 family protein deacetylase
VRDRLVPLLRDRRIVALTGAGISTESGIPDYRGPETRRRARNPIRFREYIASDDGRARYWARSLVGWPRLARAAPNAAHRALAELERDGHLLGVITQNVDRLHQGAGSRSVVELHGALAEVYCLACGRTEPRAALQARLEAANPHLRDAHAALAPDGDADLPDALLEGFQVMDCETCGGPLKPSVVFFGESVAPAVVKSAYALLDAAEALLVAGTSLAVYSGLRFVRRARELGLPVALVNLGETRGDALADVRISASTGSALPALARLLGSCPSPPAAPRRRA